MKNKTLSVEASRRLKDTDVYSKEYLAFARRKSNLKIIFNPRNEFNADQDLPSAARFEAANTSDGAAHMKVDFGVDVLRRSLYRDRLVVNVTNRQRYIKFVSDLPAMEALPASLLQPQWAQSVLLNVDKTLDVLRAGRAKMIQVTVADSDRKPVPRAKVLVIFKKSESIGTEVTTDKAGRATLAVPADWTEVESFAVVPEHSLWTHAQAPWTIPTGPVSVTLNSLKSHGTHPLHDFVSAGKPEDGSGVVVGVIDSGVGPHRDLVVAGGSNHVATESATPELIVDSGLSHGTHVAGIIAGRGVVDPAYRGLAPGVTLRSYRVFAAGARDCETADVADAIDRAVEDGCHLINLSLGFDKESRSIATALRRAAAAGVVAIAAAGNNARGPLRFPASLRGVIAVSAIGKSGSVPADTISALAVAEPFGTDKAHFLAAFTNIGVGLSATAPGVGIISCFPGDLYAGQDGTSMSAPVVTGLAARLLGNKVSLRDSEPTQKRAEEIVSLVLSKARQLGFIAEHVGRGLP